MMQSDKFLNIGVRTGKIKVEARRYALEHQRQRKLNQERMRVGEILVGDGLLTDAVRDEILAEQQRLRTARLYRIRQLAPAIPSLLGQRLIIVILAVGGVALATYLGAPLDKATGVAGFITFTLITILEYRALHSTTLSLIRALILCSGLFVLASFFYSVFTFARLDEITDVNKYSNPQAIAMWLFRIKAGFLALGAAALTLGVYSIWKFHALRYTQARLGLMKDIIIRVEAALRDKTKLADERNAEAVTIILKGLRNAIRLSLPDRTLRRFTLFFPGRDQITVMFFTPEPAARSFRLNNVLYPEDAPEKVREAFSWMQTNHFPKFLDQSGFNRLLKMAKGLNPEGWRQRYLNFPDRYEFISVCGWVYEKKETLFSRDASQCLAYDGRYFDGIKELGLTKDDLSWINFGSFIACPVLAPDGSVGNILLVAKSRNNSLEPEDLEITIVASQLLGRILQVRKEDVNGA
ncbi:MAG TPA: hypothetical protein VEY11_11965 [Pyrinomonadaceae bacterium]|nr:hypothetical protein [Pyrinomonadaceae bacterium]